MFLSECECYFSPKANIRSGIPPLYCKTREEGPETIFFPPLTKTKMADRAENASSVGDGNESETEVTERDSTVSEQILKMWKLQQESNVQFQKQMMQVLSTMAGQHTSAQSISAGSPVASTPALDVVRSAMAHIRLSPFDPDDTPFSMTEWMDDVTRIQQEIGISDTLIVLKAGDALRGRAARFYKQWKPLVRDWVTFRQNFEVAFPEQGTPATRMRACLAIVSADYASLVEYGNTKLAAIKRFYAGFPWEIILSLLEDDLQDKEVKSRISIQEPTCEADLLKLLAACDARKSSERKQQPLSTQTGGTTDRFRKRRRDSPPRYARAGPSMFPGKCRKCDRYGHKQVDCKQVTKTSGELTAFGPTGTSPDKSTANKVCTYCKKIGHTENVCYRKQGSSKRVMLTRKTRFTRLFPLAAITNDKSVVSVPYLVDTAADVSVIHEKVVRSLNLEIKPGAQDLTGLGNNVTKPIGRCTAVLCTPSMTLDVDFTVVPDGTIPGDDIDVLVGLDVLKRPGIKVEVGANGVDIVHDPFSLVRVLNIQKFDENDVDVSGLDERVSTKLKVILREAREQTPTAVTTGKLKISLRDSHPVAYRPRHLAYTERLQVKRIIEEQLQEGIIRESESSYASPIVLVKKRNGDIRMCVDFREVNKRVLRDHYPLPRIQDQIDNLAKAVYFCTLDMKSGFYQVEIEESSKHITAFVTPDGLYEYNRLPFGFVNSPSCYQRAIDKALGSLKDNIAFVYIDDVLCPAKTIEEGLERLREVINTLSKAGFVLNLSKCKFFQTTIEYLGVVIEGGTVKPSPRKVEALVQTVAPSDVKGVRQFLGLAGYFRRFIKNFACLTAPITVLLRKGQPFLWTAECERIRLELVKKLTEYPILNIFNPDLETELYTDASSVGLGAMLMQKGTDNLSHPVAYFSRRTTDCESRYHSYDLETLIIVEATHYFRAYLYGIKFTIYTDCNSVRATALKKELHPRVARWWIKLQDFNFDIAYRPGAKMAHVDYLSRNTPSKQILVSRTVVRDRSSKSIREYQADDPFCQSVIDKTCSEPGYSVKDQMVYFQSPYDGRYRCFVPVPARLNVLRLYHDESSHIGVDKMLAKLREDLIWPRMRKSARKYVANCRSCILGKSPTGKKRGLCQQIAKPSRKLDTWHIDHAGPLVRSNKCTQILVIIDAFTKYVRFCPIRQKTTDCTIKALSAVFDELGTPQRIIADRGTAFQAGKFKQFLTERSVELHLIATGVPRGNGQVERVMRSLFNAMRAVLNEIDEKKWTQVLPAIEDDFNVTINKTTGYSPNALMFGETRRLKAVEQLLADIPTQSEVMDADLARENVIQRMESVTKQATTNFNRKRVPAVPYTVGDRVAIQDTQLAAGGKLKPKFFGPFEVTHCLENERYALRRIGGSRRTTVAAHEHLRTWPQKGMFSHFF